MDCGIRSLFLAMLWGVRQRARREVWHSIACLCLVVAWKKPDGWWSPCCMYINAPRSREPPQNRQYSTLELM